ncbi:MAG: DivIVA domain-containing protein [Corynebacterium sp.]|jgi:cell division septum initiation protein DivIVA|nr:DivIVA domain-containing protein [Corynebacterium sp.]
MYRVFETLDELVQTVEEAYGVPMTANCMVPRRDVLVLLDELRNAFPAELDDAQDVLDQRDVIIGDAEATAAESIAGAEEEARRIMDEAEDRARRMVEDAENRAHATVAEAQDEANRRRDDADREYRQVTERAASEADRLVASGNAAYDRSVQDGLAEQQRLVSESTVVHEANEEARRVVETAYADSNRLRGECDVYVDNKLAEFEASLSETLRSVGRDRSALRKGAGASGAVGADRSDRSERSERPDREDHGGERQYDRGGDYRR